MNPIVLEGATLIDGTGRDPIANSVVVLDKGRIAAIGAATERVNYPTDARILKVKGKWLIPGLINCHDHIFNKGIRKVLPGVPTSYIRDAITQRPDMYLVLEAAYNALQELREGVTATRDLGSRHGMAIQLRNAIADGFAIGPRVLACGEAVCMTGGHFYMYSRQADGPDGVREAVREQLHAGADCIKLMASGGLTSLPKENPGQVQFTVEEMRAGVEEAHKRERLVAAHAQATQAVRNSLEAGVDSVEHGFLMDESTTHLMQQLGVSFVPTVNVPFNATRRYRNAGDMQLADYMEKNVLGPHRDAFRRAADKGILIGAGTDSAGFLFDEMKIMVDFGFSPAEALAAGTRNAARICGIANDAGTIEAGKFADIVILEQNPLSDILALQQVTGVVKGGELLEVNWK
jgi:imidazolonepropionase-like amidohydrolase